MNLELMLLYEIFGDQLPNSFCNAIVLCITWNI